MPLPGYDRMGNSIGVPLRYYDRNANEISASTFSKTNNDLTIKLDPPLSNEFLTMKKRKDDFNNNFKMPEPFVLKVESFKPINTFKPFIPEIEPFKIFEPKFESKPVKFKPIEIEPLKIFNQFEPVKRKKYDPIDFSTW